MSLAAAKEGIGHKLIPDLLIIRKAVPSTDENDSQKKHATFRQLDDVNGLATRSRGI